MSNEEQMRAEFETWAKYTVRADRLPLDRHPNGSYLDSRTYVAFYAWKAATASKQQEIDAFNQQLLEQAALVEKMREALFDSDVHIRSNANGGLSELAVIRANREALAIEPSTALAAHDNEVAAKVLEEAEVICNSRVPTYQPSDEYVRGYDAGCNECGTKIHGMVTERRNRK